MRGQLNLDFVGGFGIFMLALVFVITAVTINIPPYQQALKSNNLKIEAWMLSERLINGVEAEDYVLDDLSTLPYTFPTDYDTYRDYLKPSLGVGDRRNFNIKIEEFPVGIANTGLHNGVITLEGNAYPFVISDIGPTGIPDGVYDTVAIDSGDYMQGETFQLVFTDYTVEKIDKGGNYFILNRTMLHCGIKPSLGVNNIKTLRYSTFDGHMVKIYITYW